MAEQIAVYDPRGKPLGSRDRDEYYDEVTRLYLAGKPITELAGVVWVLVMTPDGLAYVQLRSKQKQFNRRKWCKGVGGHQTYGFSPSYIAEIESLQELGAPITVVTKADFAAAREHRLHDLDRQGVALPVKRIVGHVSTRIEAEGTILQFPQVVYLYAAWYNGTVLYKDKEVDALRTFNAGDLQEFIIDNQADVTSDLKRLARYYSRVIRPIAEYKVP